MKRLNVILIIVMWLMFSVVGYAANIGFVNDELIIGTITLEDKDGCLGAPEFHAHGKVGVAGYIKMGHGTTPSIHVEAGHSILWIDSDNKLYLRKSDGTDTVLTGQTDIYNRATGWLEGGQISINADNTKIDVSAGSVSIVDSSTPIPTYKIISWTAQTALDPTLATRSIWVGVKDDGMGAAEFVYDINFDSVERRTTAILGRVWDSAGAGPQITNVGNYKRPAWGLLTAFQDFVMAYGNGSWNISGNIYSPNGINLLLDKSSGESFRYHAKATPGRENIHLDSTQSPRTPYTYHLQSSNITTSEPDIEPDYYDNGGVKTALGNNVWTVQEIWYFPVSGTCHVLYGQVIYGAKDDAIGGITTESKVRNEDILYGAILRAYLIVEKGCTDLTDLATAEIREAKAGGGSSSGGDSGISSIVEDTTPQLGGDLDVNGNKITSASNGDIEITPDGTGNVGIGANSPNSPLHIKANTPGTVGTYPAGQIIIQSPADSVWANAVITGYESDANGDPHNQLWYLGSSSSSNSNITLLNRRNASLSLGTNSIFRLTVLGNGDVGIGTITPTAKLEVNGYTKLGSDAPAIKMKKYTGTTDATEGSSISFAHGLTASKIISITALVDADTDLLLPPAFQVNSEFQYDIWVNGANVNLKLHDTNSGNILSKSYKILVTYEE